MRPLRLLRRALVLLVLLVVIVVAVTAGRVWYVARQDDRSHVDAIVVLGASQFNGTPSAVFQARLEHARDLYQAGVAPRVITVGGGQPGDQFTEAAAGERWLAAHGVPDLRLLAVGKGLDTLQSMRALGPLMKQRGWKTAVLVTDPWHELRSRRMAHDVGIAAGTSPARSGPAVRTRGTEIRYVLRETAAYLYYLGFHRSAEAGPRAV